MDNDKRPLLSRQDAGATDSEHGSSSGNPAGQTRSQGLQRGYGTWEDSSNARQDPSSLQPRTGFTDLPVRQRPQEPLLSVSAPTVASLRDFPQGLSINTTTEDTLIPENTQHIPADAYQSNNDTPEPHFIINSHPSGGTRDLYQHQDTHCTAEDTHCTAEDTHCTAEDTQDSDTGISQLVFYQGHIPTQAEVNSSKPSTSTDNSSTYTASAAAGTARYPLNIKNRIQRSRSSSLGLSRSTTDTGAHYTQDDREPLHRTGPNMEHAHFTNSKKPVSVQDKDEKTPPFVYVLACFATIGGLLFGYDTGIVSGAMLLIKDYFHLSTIWQEIIVSATVGAAAIFSLLAGVMCDRLGRKITIMVASVVFVAGAVIMGAAQSKEVLLIGRLVVGIGIGTFMFK